VTVAVVTVGAVAVAVTAILLLGGVSVPFLPPLSKASAPSTADAVALLAGGLTGLLAVGTFILAAYTRQAVRAGFAETRFALDTLREVQRQVEIADAQVTATNRQAEVAQATLEASWRPLLTDVPRGQYEETAQLFGAMATVNDYGRVSVVYDSGAFTPSVRSHSGILGLDWQSSPASASLAATSTG
jgi:hypothetical protein